MGPIPRRTLNAGAARPAGREASGEIAALVAVAVGIGVVLSAVWVAPLRAQDPTPPDTTAAVPDTTAPAPDTAAADTTAESASADSVYPIPQLVVFGQRTETDWVDGRWIWDHDDLLASGAFSLADLIGRLPGVTTVRDGGYGMPQIVTAFGLTGGRTELFLDGYRLDPIGSAAIDLSTVPLHALDRVRVERRAGRLRIHVETLEPADNRPYSRVEAARGDRLAVDLFRGVFLAPDMLGGRLSLGVERLNTSGRLRAEPATLFSGWFKWSTVREDSSGIQLEYRRDRLTREALPYPGEATREDWVVRGRLRPAEGLTTEFVGGISSVEQALPDDVSGGDLGSPGDGAVPTVPATPGTIRALQAGVRARYDAERHWTGAALRLRDHPALPTLELAVDGGVRLPGDVRVDGDLRAATWTNGDPTTSFSLRSRWEPITGLAAFAELSRGTVGVPFARSRVDTPLAPDTAGAPAIDRRNAVRAGLRYDRGGFGVGAAAVALDADSVRTFGLPFEGTPRRLHGGDVRGIEADLRLPLFWEPLTLEASYTGWLRGDAWSYLPERTARAALTLHDLPLESGNLEILARLEGHHRGPVLMPSANDDAIVRVPHRTLFDFYFQIRIMSVRAFARWENILHRTDVFDVSGRPYPGQRFIYGIKWEFWN